MTDIIPGILCLLQLLLNLVTALMVTVRDERIIALETENDILRISLAETIHEREVARQDASLKQKTIDFYAENLTDEDERVSAYEARNAWLESRFEHCKDALAGTMLGRGWAAKGSKVLLVKEGEAMP